MKEIGSNSEVCLIRHLLVRAILFLLGNPLLKKGNVSGIVWGVAPDLELNFGNTLHKSCNLLLLAPSPSLPSSTCKIETTAMVIISLGKVGEKNF